MPNLKRHSNLLKARLAALIKRRARTGTVLERRAYYTFVNRAFSREQDFVAAGQTEYFRQLEGGLPSYLIRRNVHMLEKGLVMVPRRPSFAADYIVSTVEAVTAAAGVETGRLSRFELEWAIQVLEEYFDATRESTDTAVTHARALYKDSQQTGFFPADTVRRTPTLVDTGGLKSCVDELEALARGRKSVRWFLPTHVSRDIVDRAVQIASEAPSACNRQPYVIRLLDDPAEIASVASIPMGTKGYAHSIPGLAAFIGDFSAFFDERDRHLIYIDGCLAAMSFVLGLESQGVQTCCINWPDIADKEEAMRAVLGLPRHMRPIMLVAYGYADPEQRAPHSERRPLDVLRKYGL